MPVKAATARIESGDILHDTFDIKFGDKTFVVIKSGPRIDISLPNKSEPLGFIRFGGSLSGAIWENKECIGEFEMQGNTYSITPISKGRKLPDKVVKVDPVTFLLQRVLQNEK